MKIEVCGLVIWTFCIGVTPAATLLEPGYSDVLIGTIAPGILADGGLIEDRFGNLYATVNGSQDVFRCPPGGTFTSLATIPSLGGYPQCMEVVGTILHVGTMGVMGGRIFTVDLTLPSPTPQLLDQIPSAEILDMVIDCDTWTLAVLTGQAVYRFEAGSGLVPYYTVTSQYTGLACPGGGDLLAARFDLDRIFRAPPPPGMLSTLANVGRGPDAIAIHPVTGEIFVATSVNSILEKVDPTGASVTAFATDMSFTSGYGPTPLAFSRDGTKLYYGTLPVFTYEVRAICGFPPVQTPCTSFCGDCNLSSTGPDTLDGLAAAQIAVGILAVGPDQSSCCDVNDSGAVDIIDSLLISQVSVGLPIILVCP